MSSARSVSYGADAGGRERRVQADLLGGHRLDLDDLALAGRLHQVGDDAVGLGGVAPPSGPCRRRRSTASSSRMRWRSRCRSVRSLIARPASRKSSQSASSPMTASRLSRMVPVACAGCPQLGVGERVARRLGEGAGVPQPDDVVGATHRAVLPWRPGSRPGACPDAGTLSRDRPPPMCIRQELSPAHTDSAPVSRTWRILSASIALDTSAFFSANVPPKPQQDSAAGSRRGRCPSPRAAAGAGGHRRAACAASGRSDGR